MWCPGMQRVEGAACWGAWTGAVSSPPRGSQASRQPSSPSCPLLCRRAGRGEKEKASEAGGEGRGQRRPSHTSCPESPGPSSWVWDCAAGEPGGGYPAGPKVAPSLLTKPDPAPGPGQSQISPRCVHRWLICHPPGTRGWAWVSPSQVGCQSPRLASTGLGSSLGWGGGRSGTADPGVGRHPLRQPPPALPEGPVQTHMPASPPPFLIKPVWGGHLCFHQGPR